MDAVTIRTAVPADLDTVVQVETACFPAAEAADRKSSKEHLDVFPRSLLAAKDGDRIIGFINGAVVNERTIGDEMFEDTPLHGPEGVYQSIFDLDMIEEYRRQGVASRLMEAMVERARSQGHRGLILTCKDRLIGYYETSGYVNMGIPKSVHGGIVWYNMILEFQQVKITLVMVGKIKEPYLEDAIREHARRLSRHCKLGTIQVADEKTPNGAGEAIVRQIKEKGRQRVLFNIEGGAYAIILAVKGKTLTNEELAGRIQKLGVDEIGHIVFIIGGPLGLSGDVMKQADYALSFSEMTFSHQLMRVVLPEQTYRSYGIVSGEPYHRWRL